nr:uncharacterized protein LOC111511914 [Leptinotarsa decemlineata]
MDEALKNEIVSCIEKSVNSEFFSEVKIDFAGTNEKGEGYVADFIFATVRGIDKDNKTKEIHLAVKYGKRGKEFRDNMMFITDGYKREIFVYDKIFGAFKKFQRQKNMTDTFSSVPKCYGTFLSDNIEALVLENLKQKGLKLHSATVPMNMQHIRLVLKNYAELHALSFALRDQDKESFDEIAADLKSIMISFISNTDVFKGNDHLSIKLREIGREDLAIKYENKMEKSKDIVLLQVLEDVPQESVVTHGDCHNNNFLFKYKDNDQENPQCVVIIDWQVSELHSPVLDLSYFLYSAASHEVLSQLKDVLKFYHLHLTEFMQKLGSDAGKIFPWDTLVQHWRKYSSYGFTMSTSVLGMHFSDKGDDPSIEDFGNNSRKEKSDVKIINEDLYNERLIAIA